MGDSTGYVPWKKMVGVGLLCIGFCLVGILLAESFREQHVTSVFRERFETVLGFPPEAQSPELLMMVSDHIEDLCVDMRATEWHALNVVPWPASSQDDSWAYHTELKGKREKANRALLKWSEALAVIHAVEYPLTKEGCDWTPPIEEE
jgi:hypothetical protein